MDSISYIRNYTEWKKDFSFYTTINVRFSETDMFGHVNNVSAFIYFEEGRIKFLTAKGLIDNAMDEGGVPVVADLQCNYHKQMYFNDQIKLYVKAAHIGTTSTDIHYLGINNQGDVCLTGRGRLVYVNAKTGKPIPLTDSIKEALVTS